MFFLSNLLASILRYFHRTSTALRARDGNASSTIDEKKESRQLQDADASLWDSRAGTMLHGMLQMGAHSPKATRMHTAFFSTQVATALGPYPYTASDVSVWKSFMTDDHTPIELSWNWRPHSTLPTVRYSIEPIGREAGSSRDSLNTAATFRLLAKITSLYREIDIAWFSSFFSTLMIDETTMVTLGLRDDTPGSQIFLAFDLLEDRIMLKVYFLPALKAIAEGRSAIMTSKEAFRSLKGESGTELFDLRLIWEHLEAFPAEVAPKLEIIAVDAEDICKARVKIYIRSSETSFASVVDMLEMGGRLPKLSGTAIASLKDLWQSVLDVEGTTPDSESLPGRSHRTAGILYYFSVKAGASRPKAKVYLPVRHYGRDDHDIARGFSTFLKKRGKCLKGGTTYLNGLKRLCKHRTLEDALGLHTYISCTCEGDELDITSYFNPESRHHFASKI